jgi:hypothetical protein
VNWPDRRLPPEKSLQSLLLLPSEKSLLLLHLLVEAAMSCVDRSRCLCFFCLSHFSISWVWVSRWSYTNWWNQRKEFFGRRSGYITRSSSGKYICVEINTQKVDSKPPVLLGFKGGVVQSVLSSSYSSGVVPCVWSNGTKNQNKCSLVRRCSGIPWAPRWWCCADVRNTSSLWLLFERTDKLLNVVAPRGSYERCVKIYRMTTFVS